MIVLAIHTAGPACDVALLDRGETLGERQEAMLRGQDAKLPDLVTAVLSDADTPLAKVDRFAVVTGPGSFTGIRVGVAFARGLALATSKPCVGVTTMEASLPSGQQGSAIVALQAQKRPPDITFWCQTFRTGEATAAPTEMLAADLARLVTERPHALFGEIDTLMSHVPQQFVQAASPTASQAARVAMRLDPDTRPARPTYVRAPDAALPLKKKNG